MLHRSKYDRSSRDGPKVRLYYSAEAKHFAVGTERLQYTPSNFSKKMSLLGKKGYTPMDANHICSVGADISSLSKLVYIRGKLMSIYSVIISRFRLFFNPMDHATSRIALMNRPAQKSSRRLQTNRSL